MAHEAFASPQREVRWCPDDEHYPGNFVVLDAYGERRVAWDEEIVAEERTELRRWRDVPGLALT
jgi:hypothetical protein